MFPCDDEIMVCVRVVWFG